MKIKAFLSHRYGSRCLPARIVENEYEMLKTELEKSEKITADDLKFHHKIDEENVYNFENIFLDCYQLDRNEIPARFKLKPLNVILKNFDSKDAKFKDLHLVWARIEEKLGNLLRTAADGCLEKGLMSPNRHERYFISVTQKEIVDGILNANNIENNVL